MIPFLKKFWPFLLLAILSFTLHFAFLSYPSEVVFDETHFGKFVAAYFTGQYYFDIHPPLGKLLIAGFSKLNNFNPAFFSFDHISQVAPPRLFFILRFMPALFGSLFVLAFAWLAYLISRSRLAALLAGFLILLDNAFLAQSKFILVDIFLLSFEILTLCFFFLYQHQKIFGKKWLGYLGFTGLFFGCTISIKWTGLATIGIIGVVLLAKIFSQKLRNYLEIPSSVIPAKAGIHPAVAGRVKPGMTKRATETILAFLIILIIGFIVYTIPFYIHFKLLPKSGPGDAFMSLAFQEELKNGPNSAAAKLTFWSKFTELNKTMFRTNAGLTAGHPFGSRWYEWPLDKKAIYYWMQGKTPENKESKIYFFGNPILWWLSGLAVLLTLIASFIKKFRPDKPEFFILILAYLANFLPFIFIKRVAFLYHYLPAVMFAILLLSLWLAKLWPKEKKILAIVLILILFNFLVLLPFSYGWPAI